MPRITSNRRTQETGQPSWDVALRSLVSRMACACAESAAHAQAPLARALFHRVEVMKQPPDLAAQELGIATGDAAYLLAGLREDVVNDLVLGLNAARLPGKTKDRKVCEK